MQKSIMKMRKLFALVMAVCVLMSGQPVGVLEAEEMPSLETTQESREAQEDEEVQESREVQEDEESQEKTCAQSVCEDVASQGEASQEQWVCSSGLTEEMRQRYIEDGSYEERCAFVQTLEAENSEAIEQGTWQKEECKKYLSSGDEESVLLKEQPEERKAEQLQNMPYSGLMPSVGDVKALVFLVDFPDYQQLDSTIDSAYVKRQLFDGEDNSVTGYYGKSSYGKLNLTGDVYGYYTAKYEAEHYNNGPVGRQELIMELMEYYDAQIDYSKYDADGDGLVDGLYIDYMMTSEGWGNFWWNYQATWRISDESDELVAVNYDGVGINRYVWLNRTVANITPIYKTYLHETGHLLGLLDYYDSSSGSAYEAIGTADMMSTNLGDHNAVSKILMGWIEPQIITENCQLELNSSAIAPEAVIIYPEGNKQSDEYFVVEYVTAEENNYELRLEIGAGGIRIWRVNSALNDQGTDYKYDNSADGIHFIESLGEADQNYVDNMYGKTRNGNKLNLYYENDALTPYTTPSSYLCESADDRRGPFKASGISVKNIYSEDGKILAEVYYDDVKREEFSYISIDYEFDNALLIDMTFDVETTLLDESAIKVYSGDTELEIIADLFHYTGNEYKKLIINSFRMDLDEDTELVLHIEPGALIDVFGNTNEEIVKTLSPQKNWKIDGTLDISHDLITPDYVVMDDNHAWTFEKTESGLVLNVVSADEEKVSYQSYEILDIEVDITNSGERLELCKLENGNVVLAIRGSESGKTRLYLFESVSDYRYVGTYSCVSRVVSMCEFEENILLYSERDAWEIIDLNTGNAEKIDLMEIDFWETNLPKKVGDIGYVVHEGTNLYLFDSSNRLIAEIDNEDYKYFSKEEYICNIFEEGGNIVVFTATSQGGVVATVLDEKFTLLSKKIILANGFYHLNQIHKVSGGYFLEGDITSKLSASKWLGKGAGWMMIVGKCVYLDKDFDIVATVTKFGTKARSFMLDNRIFFRNSKDSDGIVRLYYSKQDNFDEKIQLEQGEIMLEDEQINAYQDNNYQLRLKSDYSYVNQEIIWKSSNPAVASVGVNGTVCAKEIGKTTITMICGECTDTCEVTVYPSAIYAGIVEFLIMEGMVAYLEKGTLTIDWTHDWLEEMPSFDWGDGTAVTPWNEYRDQIKRVVIDEGITSVGNCAFMDCKNLTSISLPESLTSIEMFALKNSGIKELVIPAGVTYMGIEMSECPDLENIYIDDENASYAFEDGVLYNYDKTRVLGCSVKKNGTVVLPDTVEKCQRTAFKGCKEITELQVSPNLKEVPELEGCVSLKKIILPDGFMGTFSEDCFYTCNSLKSLVLPEFTESIPLETIYHSSLSKVVVKGMDTEIDDSSFYYDEEEGFEGITECILYVYQGSVAENFMKDGYVNGGYEELEKTLGIVVECVSLVSDVNALAMIEVNPESDCKIVLDGAEQYLRNVPVSATYEDVLACMRNNQDMIRMFDCDGVMITDKKAVISTGAYVQFVQNGVAVDSAYIVVSGDVDGNGKINVLDMEEIQKDILGLNSLNGANKQAAMMNGQAELTVLDIESIQRYILGVTDIL